jgi:ABC-type glycerol-3-phosphate transport system substrate-binding protein
LAAVSLTLIAGAAQARCDKLISPKAGEVNIIGNSFPALAHIAKEMETCSQNGVKVQFKMTPNARTEIEQSFAVSGPVAFEAAVVSSGVYSGLNAKGQLQSMTDLVAKYKTKYKIEDSMLIKVNGEVMAIAFMANAQNLYYRKDLFDKHGIKVPTTYPEMLAAGKMLTKNPPFSTLSRKLLPKVLMPTPNSPICSWVQAVSFLKQVQLRLTLTAMRVSKPLKS